MRFFLSVRIPLALASLATAAAVTGCSTHTESSTESTSLTYTFKETINSYSCETGTHTASDQAGYCAALKDEAANNYCAYSQRKATFQASCPGQFDNN